MRRVRRGSSPNPKRSEIVITPSDSRQCRPSRADVDMCGSSIRTADSRRCRPSRADADMWGSSIRTASTRYLCSLPITGLYVTWLLPSQVTWCLEKQYRTSISWWRQTQHMTALQFCNLQFYGMGKRFTFGYSSRDVNDNIKDTLCF